MDKNADKLGEKFEELKNMLTTRASSSLGEAALKLFLKLLDGYQEELTQALKAGDKAVADTKDENAMLLGLVGIQDPGVRAKLISQAAEIRFLREEVLALRATTKELENKNSAFELEVERLKNELSISLKEREKDQKASDKRLEDFGSALKGYEAKVDSSTAELDAKRSEIEHKLAAVRREIEIQSEAAVKKAVVRLNNICGEIGEASGVFSGEIEKLKEAARSQNKKKPSIFSKTAEPVDNIAQILPSFNLLSDKVQEAANILKKYMETFTSPEVKPIKVNFNKLFDDLKKRYGSQASARKLKISWPAGKTPADFVSDQALLFKAFSNILLNSIEALPVEGEIEISLSFNDSGAELGIKDNGKEIKPEQREMLFTPLYTTKSSHYGLGLVDCRMILRTLGGDAVYMPVEGGNSFKLTFEALRPAAPKAK